MSDPLKPALVLIFSLKKSGFFVFLPARGLATERQVEAFAYEGCSRYTKLSAFCPYTRNKKPQELPVGAVLRACLCWVLTTILESNHD